MAKTESTMVELGTSAPDFHLKDVISENTYSLTNFSDRRALLVMFICNHCPFVVHIQKGLVDLGNEYKNSELGIVAISSNDIEQYPEDSPKKMKQQALELGFSFPYLFDETQEVAKAYQAACTPDFFLFDEERKLVYRGQFDESRPGSGIPVTGQDLRRAITAVLQGEPPLAEQRPSIGCNIKWRS